MTRPSRVAPAVLIAAVLLLGALVQAIGRAQSVSSVSPFPIPDTTYHWVGEIAVDSATGALLPGWQNGDTTVARHGIFLCEVATKMPGYHRVLLSAMVSPVVYNTACQAGAAAWAAAEAASNGAWPNP